MKRNIIKGLIFSVSLTLSLPFLVNGNFTPIAFAENVIIICHPDVPENSLNKNDIKNIFLGKKTEWGDNKKIIFVVLKENETHETFLKEYVEKTSFQYLNYWKKQVFTGKGKPPKSFDTENELIDYVANTEGAIGYVSAGIEKKNVKVISVH